MYKKQKIFFKVCILIHMKNRWYRYTKKEFHKLLPRMYDDKFWEIIENQLIHEVNSENAVELNLEEE